MATVVDDVRNLRGQQRIMGLLIVRDLKVRYAGSLLGYVWTVLDPLLMALVYWFIFTEIFHRGGVGERPYIVFLLCGLLPWNWVNGALIDSAKALSQEAKLVRSSNLPREIWVVRVVASKFVEFLFSIPVLAIFMVVFHKGASWYVLTVPVAMALQAVLLLGLSLFLAPVSVLFTDVPRLVRIILRMLFYLSPVVYGLHSLPPVARRILTFNPLTGIFELYRAALFPETFERAHAWPVVGVAAVISVLLLGFGLWVFRRLEGVVLKEI